MEIDTIAVVGPTASGKTARAVSIARTLNAEIVSGDSRQVYRGMTIGTGKDLDEYGEIPYHLIDIENPGEKYNLHRYLRDFNSAHSDIISRGKKCVLCGGSGMYVEAALRGWVMPEVERNEMLRSDLESKSNEELIEILKGYKTLHNVTDIDTRSRILRAIEIQDYYVQNPEEASMCDPSSACPLNALVIGIDIDRENRRKRISNRLHQRLNQGMIEEVRNLIASGITPEQLIYYGLEYKFVTKYVISELSYDEMVNNLEIAIHQFAKRQMTWFRGMERRGLHIEWLPWDMPENEFVSRVSALLHTRTNAINI